MVKSAKNKSLAKIDNGKYLNKHLFFIGEIKSSRKWRKIMIHEKKVSAKLNTIITAGVDPVTFIACVIMVGYTE